jgi:molybdenum cofactor synthesis domain-containing protein
MAEQRDKSPDSHRAVIITVSDRSARGERPDTTGPRAVEILQAEGFDTELVVIPDGAESVSAAIRFAVSSGAKLVITSGGTGVGPRDLTPEGTRPLLERELPGIAEEFRRDGASKTPMALLSRGVAGIVGTSLVVNLPGSLSAVEDGLRVVLPLVPHILDQVRGGDH